MTSLRQQPQELLAHVVLRSGITMKLLLESFGWLGFGLCFACWFPQTAETIRTRSCPLNVRFLLLNFSGCLVLIVHSVARYDLPFIILNSVCAGGAAINLWYSFHPRGSKVRTGS